MIALRSGIAVETENDTGMIIGAVSVRLSLSEQVAERQLFAPIISPRVVVPSLPTVSSAILIQLREVTGPLFPKKGVTAPVSSLCTNSIPTVFDAVFSPSVAISILKGVAVSLFVRSNKSPLKVVSIWKSGFF